MTETLGHVSAKCAWIYQPVLMPQIHCPLHLAKVH